jgi:hypothetical protein
MSVYIYGLRTFYIGMCLKSLGRGKSHMRKKKEIKWDIYNA